MTWAAAAGSIVRRRFPVSLVLTAAALALVVGVASANHILPSPRVFWDFDNDGIAEETDSFARFSRGGGSWTQQKISRADEAVTTWRGSTQFNPALYSTVQTAKIWVDGEDPKGNAWGTCTTSADQWVFGEIIGLAAINCVDAHVHTPAAGDYFHIVDSDIFLNSDNVAFDWGTSSNGSYSGRGVIAHEMGHSALLEDAEDCLGSGNSLITMCEQVTGSNSWLFYSLTDHDIVAANAIYLP